MSESSSRQLEVHYINTDFTYSAAESFMDFFQGLLYTPPHPPPLHHQEGETEYWSYYKYGYSSSAPASSSYNFRHSGPLFLEDVHASVWSLPAMPTNPSLPAPPLNPNPTLPLEDCVREVQYSTMHTMAPQGGHMYWQNNINPDNMTYEELLDLGETVGTQNKGLSQDLIAKLPVTKYKRCFFSRKKSRCVICQMDFKRKDTQMTLPCKHIYHDECIKKWLAINKACPICYVEVTGESSKG